RHRRPAVAALRSLVEPMHQVACRQIPSMNFSVEVPAKDPLPVFFGPIGDSLFAPRKNRLPVRGKKEIGMRALVTLAGLTFLDRPTGLRIPDLNDPAWVIAGNEARAVRRITDADNLGLPVGMNQGAFEPGRYVFEHQLSARRDDVNLVHR